MHTLYQRHQSEHRWTKDHPLEQVRGNPSKPVQTRRQLATYPEMCMFALTVSTAEPKNIKDAMADFAWIEAMQDELHQFNRLQGYAREEGIDFKESFALVARLEDFRSTNLHEAVKTKLDVDLSRLPIDQTRYHSMIGALMYLTSSRPDIVQAVCYCARYPARPTKKHLKEVKRIFRYLKGTINMGLWYSKDSGFELTAFSDADHAGCLNTRKSTYRGIQFLGDKLVSWMSKKQDCTATSSAKAEYVALSTSFSHVNLMQPRATLLYQALQCPLPLYKALPKDRFQYLVRRIGMRCLTPAELEVLANESA
ncbi:hypothetical protein Tco_0265525 [Tanacetum coccineum]